MRTFSQQNQPVVANDGPAEAMPGPAGRADRPLPAPPSPVAERPRRPHTLVGLLLSLMASFFWVGIGAAFLSGYLGPDRLLALPLPQVAPIAAALLQAGNGSIVMPAGYLALCCLSSAVAIFIGTRASTRNLY